MAIRPDNQYPGMITPGNPDYPYGQGRNITQPGDGTGTPWEAAIINDMLGFFQALLVAGNITPSGNADTARVSQYLEAARAAINAGAVTQAFRTIASPSRLPILADGPTDTLNLVAGTNMTIQTNPTTDTVTFSVPGVVSATFRNILVSGEPTVQADRAEDTLTLVAGTNMTIETNSATDTITFNATGGAPAEGGNPNRGNAFLNPRFDVWQRGTSFNITDDTFNHYTADRMRVRGTGFQGNQINITRMAPGIGSTFFYRIEQESGANRIEEPIEDVRTFSGMPVSFRIRCRAPSGGITIILYATQNFGTSGSPQVDTNIGGLVIPNSANFAEYVVENVQIPTVVGKTFGSDNYIAIGLQLASGGVNLDIDEWQIAEGTTAAPFSYRPKSQSLSDCQRYYEIAYASGGGYYPLNLTTHKIANVNYATVKRVSPTTTATVRARSGVVASATTPGSIYPSASNIGISMAGVGTSSNIYGDFNISLVAEAELPRAAI